jgi:hypothetical protein
MYSLVIFFIFSFILVSEMSGRVVEKFPIRRKVDKLDGNGRPQQVIQPLSDVIIPKS